MTKSDIEDIVLGVALVVLGYAAYSHYKAQQVQQQPQQVGAFKQPAPWDLDITKISPITSMRDLLSGTVHDIGGFEGRNYLAELEGPWWK